MAEAVGDNPASAGGRRCVVVVGTARSHRRYRERLMGVRESRDHAASERWTFGEEPESSRVATQRVLSAGMWLSDQAVVVPLARWLAGGIVASDDGHRRG
jgi:hypothetical protein